jgi:hypothetical protein
MPGYIKVGRTDSDLAIRVRQLDATNTQFGTKAGRCNRACRYD